MAFNSIAKDYKNFNELKYRAIESQNIDRIWHYLEEATEKMNLPDTTREFLGRVQQRLENEQCKVDKEISERWEKEQKTINRRNRKIKKQSLSNKN